MTATDCTREAGVLELAAQTLEDNPRLDPIVFLRAWADRLKEKQP